MSELDFLRSRVDTLERAVSELSAMLERSEQQRKPALRHSNDAERRIREARGHVAKLLQLLGEAGHVSHPAAPEIIGEAQEWLEKDAAA